MEPTEANGSESQGIRLLRDLAKDLNDSYSEKRELKLTGNGLWNLCRKVELIIEELER